MARAGAAARAEVARRAVAVAVFTALVFAATSIIAVETPATKGFFNFGETMVYTAALLGGPLVGAVAGGVGSALADLYLGYGHYAPGTLVIKGLEGFIVGYIAWRVRRLERRGEHLLAVGFLASVVLVAIGYRYYSGGTILSLGGRQLIFDMPPEGWIAIAVIFNLLLALSVAKRGVVGALELLGVIIGGAEMVLGYFTYQVLVLGYDPIVAALEIPVNVGQALIGLVVSIPLVDRLKRMGVELQTR